MNVGYIRVSTEEQNTARQEVVMHDLGIEKLFIDKMSGKSKERPQLKAMMEFVREGDTVTVESISRFARNTKDLLELTEQLKDKGVAFVSKKEAIDTDTPTGQFMLTVFGAMAQLERDYILDRQRGGIAVAKAQGKYKGRKPIEIDDKLFTAEYKKLKDGDTVPKLMMKKLNLKPNTFYRRMRQYEIEHGIRKV